DGIRDRNVTGVQTRALPIFAAGGEYATENEDGSFTAVLDQPETLAALEQVHSLFQDATAYALDSQASQKAFEKYFNEGKVGAMKIGRASCRERGESPGRGWG